MKKLLVLLMTFVVALSSTLCLIGCGDTETADTQVDIEIGYWKAGLGDEFLNEIISEFKKKNPEYNIILNASSALQEINSGLPLGESNTVDLYLTYLESFDQYDDFINMDEILNYTNEGESKTIREKINPYILNNLTDNNGVTKFIPYGGGLAGIFYNTEIIDGVKYKIPKTTDELEMLTIDLEVDEKIPFVNFGNGGYWRYLADIWQAQYDGLDYYNNNFLKLNSKGDVSVPSKSVMAMKDGRYQALKVFEEIFTIDSMYTNSNSMAFTKAQTIFLQGEAVMMVNGSWLENEMKNSVDDNVEVSLMKTPVISSIIDKCSTINDDSDLSKVIEKIDKVTEGKESIALSGTDSNLIQIDSKLSISEKDWKKIYEARNIIYSNANEHYVIIPKYSKAIEGAKKFVEFLCSDQAILIYYKNLHFCSHIRLSDETKMIDQSSWSVLNKDIFKLDKVLTPINDRTMFVSDIFIKGGATPYAGQDISRLSAKGTANGSADDIWNDIFNTVNDNWSSWLLNAGFKDEGYNQ